MTILEHEARRNPAADARDCDFSWYPQMMYQLRGFQVQGRPGFLGWALIVLALLVVIATAVFALGLFLMLLPIMVVVAVVQYFVWRWRLRRMVSRRMKESGIIEGEFRVIEPRRPH